jgi:hypothetical protein
MGLISNGGSRKGHVSIQLLHPMSNQTEGRTVRLEITDTTSRMQVVEIELDAEQFLGLMGGRQAFGAAGWSLALDRIGKTMQHGSTSYPNAFTKAEAESAARHWAATEGWDDVSVRRSNAPNWVATGRRWVTLPAEAPQESGFLYDDPQ